MPRPAATIVLVRPGHEGLEVLLTRRPDSMAFGPGLHVFPGGRLDPADADRALVGRASGSVHDPEFRVAYRIAAIRETWEEAGVLLARRRSDGTPIGLDVGSGERLDVDPGGWRPDLAGGRRPDFAPLCERFDLELETDRLVEIAHWTTPRTFPRRFDTRFFAAALPPGATVTLDPTEVVDHRWARPRDALAAMAAGEIALWPPTSTTLQRLERAGSFGEIEAGLALVPERPIGVDRVEPGLTIVVGTSAFGPSGSPANTIIIGRREVLVVDPGDPAEGTLDMIEAEVARSGGRIAAIALTHVDPGHGAGSEELRARSGAAILVGPGGAAPLSWPATEVGDGAILPAGDVSVTVLATPGHRPDHLSFRLADGTLLAGDALRADEPVVRPPEGDPVAHRLTLERLVRLLDVGTVRRVIPGHGPVLGPSAARSVARLRP